MPHSLIKSIACLALGVATAASAQSRPERDGNILVCKKGEFNLILDPLGRQVGELAVLSMWADKDDDKAGIGKISENSPNGDFVAEFFLDKNLRFPVSGPTTTIRYIAMQRLAIVLVTPAGQIAGYHVSAPCAERTRERKP